MDKEKKQGRGRPKKNKTPDWCLREETLQNGKTIRVQQVENGICLCPKRPFILLDDTLIFLMLEEGKSTKRIAELLRRDVGSVKKRILYIVDDPQKWQKIALQLQRWQNTPNKQKTIGRLLGLSRERIRQIEVEVKLRLLNKMGLLTDKRIERYKKQGLYNILKLADKKKRINKKLNALKDWVD